MIDYVAEFLEKGNLGRLNIGMTRQEVTGMIGKPNDTLHNSNNDRIADSVLLFGEIDKVNLQLAFHNDLLRGIWLYFRGNDDTSTLPQWLRHSCHWLNGTISLNGFFESAERVNLNWRLHDSLTFEDQTALLLPRSNVILIWSHDPETLFAAMLTNAIN